ncbi:C40 family peptidase [Aquabacter cavernae]|uniref:C40 family peptidase n=1 Tax=Aquabacter cavernae TaxID=2496029 RepID=UPI000F8EECC7|nr:NlpC/P60 family protein [Aquabacter cavernae]
MTRDPRLTPARTDLAAEALRGQVEAPRYVQGHHRVVAEPVVPVRHAPFSVASLDTEALLGESVTVYDQDAEGWSWVQLEADGYVGYMPSEMLRVPVEPATHKVCAPRTFLFPGPDIKMPPLATLPFGARLSVLDGGERFLRLAAGFVFTRHAVPLDARETDVVEVATRFLGTPYLWGGRSALGLDCSGLVQTALVACGLDCPRDSDMQEKALGLPVPLDGPFQRGDLLFWPGHVALVEDPQTLLHANAFHMMVAREPLAPALARIAATTPLRSARRLAV